MKAKNVLFFVWGVIAMLAVVMMIFPKDGIQITKNFILYFPSFQEMFFLKKDIKSSTKNIIYEQEELENLMDDDDYDIEKIKDKITPLDFPSNNLNALDRFFEKLENESSKSKVRIMHYGDSQIEGDRISAFVRYKLQSKFGGYGCGFLSPVNIYSQFSIKQNSSLNWIRFNGFGYGDYYSKHDKYGPLISFCRFAPQVDTPYYKTQSSYSAWVEFYESDLAYSNTKKFRDLIIFYGNSQEKVKIQIKNNNNILVIDSLEKGPGPYIYKYTSPEYLSGLKIEFEGYDSPDIYGISFEDETGIVLDNIALRGSSGTVFTTTNKELLAKSYNILGVDLFILQFGGNAVPYILDKKSAQDFANYFYYQIAFLKTVVPDACFIVIGPSDMSVKDKDQYITYPNLENIISELKKATNKAGAIYWDMYKAMGGKNSMIAWVNSNPQLAAPDYVHFTPQGTQIVANMFYNALIYEYNNYKNRQKSTAKK